MLGSIMLSVAHILEETGLADNVQPMSWMENIERLIYPSIIGAYLIFSTIRKTINKVKVKEREEKKKMDETTKKRNQKKFTDFAHQESMQYMTNMKNVCNKYRDQFAPDRVYFVQIENGTIAITGVYNMYITCIAEDDRYSRLPRVYPFINRIPYNRLSSLLEPMLEMHPHDQHVLEVSGTDEKSKEILNGLNEAHSFDIGSCLVLPVFDQDSLFVGCVLFDYFEQNFNNRDIDKQKGALKELQVSIHTMIMNYNTNLNHKREELGLSTNEEQRR